MNARSLLRRYPRAWRERYGDELLALVQETGIGWRQVADVMFAAARERARAVTESALHPVVARFVRRFFAAYVSVWLANYFFDFAGMPVARSVARADDHIFIAVLLTCAYCVSAVTHSLAFRRVTDEHISKWDIRAVGFLLLMAMAVVAWAFTKGLGPAPRSPLWIMINQVGVMFGMPVRIERVLRRTGPGLPPRPPSITRLGLSA